MTPARVAAVATAALILTGCAASDPDSSSEVGSAPTDPGRCSAERADEIARGVVHYERTPLSAVLTDSALTWVSARSVTDVGPAGRAGRATKLNELAVQRQGTRPVLDVATMPTTTLERLKERPVESVLAAINASGDVDLLISVTNGNVSFVGDCLSNDYGPAWAHYTEKAGLSPGQRSDRLLEIVRNPNGPAAARFVDLVVPDPPPAWVDRPASLRSLVPGETPAEILATLDSVSLRYDVPASWQSGDDLALCPRLAVAWNDCTLFVSPSGSEPVTARSYAAAGEGLEIWLTDPAVGSRNPLGRVAAVPAETVRDAVQRRLPLVFRPATGVSTKDDLRAAAASGRAAFVVEIGDRNK